MIGTAAAVVLPGLVGLAGGAATAGAFSRPGLPVEYLQVPSPSMGHPRIKLGSPLNALATKGR